MSQIIEVFARPWALEPSALRALVETVTRRLEGGKDAGEVDKPLEARTPKGDRPTAGMEVQHGTAVIPIRGYIRRRPITGFFGFLLGGTSVEGVRADLQSALAEPSVERIVFDVDSPGGGVDGVSDLADEIHAATKPTVAYTDGLMASAAYWLGSAADEVVASKAAQVGSIGVYAAVDDWSVHWHNYGIKTTIIKAGEHKGAGHPDTPLTEAEQKVIQEEVDDYYGLFTKAISTYRGMTEAEARQVGDGRVFIATKAQEKGLVDKIQSRVEFDATLAEPSTGEARAMADKTEAEKKAAEEKAAAEKAAADKKAAEAKAAADKAAEAEAAAGQTGAASPDAAAILVKAREEERSRITALTALKADYPEHEELIDQCIGDGTTEAATQLLLFASDRKLRKVDLTKRRSEDTEALAGGNTDDGAGKKFDAAEVKAAYEDGDEALKSKYTSAEQAVRFERALVQERKEPARA